MNEKGREGSRNSSIRHYSSRSDKSTGDRFSRGRSHSRGRPFRGVPNRHGDRSFSSRRYDGGYSGSGGSRGRRIMPWGGPRGRGLRSGYRSMGRGGPSSSRRTSFQHGSYNRSSGEGNRRRVPYFKTQSRGGNGPEPRSRRYESDHNQRGSGDSNKYGSTNTSHRQQLVGYPSESYSREHSTSSSTSRQKSHSRHHSHTYGNGMNEGRDSHNYSSGSSSHSSSKRHDLKIKHSGGKSGGEGHLDHEKPGEISTLAGQSRESYPDSVPGSDPSSCSKVENP